MTLPTALLAFKPLCDEPGCHRPEARGSDYCEAHSGCGFTDGTGWTCFDDTVEIITVDGLDVGRCRTHASWTCADTSCDGEPWGEGRNPDLCPRHADEASYEWAVDHGYTGPGPSGYR